MEIWKDIEGYEGLYQVSNLGKVKSLNYRRSGKEKLLKPNIRKDGYLQVSLCKNKKVKKILIHRLVAMVFIPNDDPTNKTEVNHISEIKSDNSVWNLEWVTPKQNANHGTRTERIAKATRNDKNRSKKVLCVELNKIFPSINEAGRQLGLNGGNISLCCNGKLKIAYGYHWEYVKE